MLELGLTLIIMLFAGIMIKRKHDPKIIMFLTGITLMILAWVLGKPILPVEQSTGIAFFDIFKVT
ncbi:MAG: hypothetical protein ACRCS6_06060, partial [Turicibacter sp.]